MKETIKKIIKDAIAKLYPEHSDIDFSVDLAPAYRTGRPDNVDADFASNAALVLAKKLGKKPMEAAERLREVIPDLIGDPGMDSRLRGNDILVNVAPPGFLNFKLSEGYLLQNLKNIDDRYGAADLGKNQLAIVEYFQLNQGKPPHVGHLRSAIIGDAIKRILSFVNYNAVSDTHIGDWGTQFGILLLAYKKLHQGKDIDLAILSKLYVEMNRQIEESPRLREEAKAEFVKLEKGDEENRGLWKKFVDLSRQEFDRSAKMLCLLPFDYDLGESFYEDKMPDILERLKEKNLLVTGETGEQYVDLEKYGLGRLICVKSDGGTTYEMRDLATVAYRYDELGSDSPPHEEGKGEVIENRANTGAKYTMTPSSSPSRGGGNLVWNLYVVDSRQSHDFRQVFKTMEMLGYDMAKSKHVEFGFMRLPEGAISDRKGNVISLEKLIEEAEKRAIKIIQEKNPKLKDKDTVAKAVALAAIKYGDLKHNRRSDIVFDWKEALSFEGNTGPYLQYTHARLRSILRKANAKTAKKNAKDAKDENFSRFSDMISDFSYYELALLRKLSYFPDIVEDTAVDFMPSALASYLYELASVANSFYHEAPVIQEEDEEKRNFRLALVAASAQVLRTGLGLLGIEAPEEM